MKRIRDGRRERWGERDKGRDGESEREREWKEIKRQEKRLKES